MQTKDIPDMPVLEFLEPRSRVKLPTPEVPGSLLVHEDGSLFPTSVQHAMPAGLPWKLARSKMASLLKRGLVDGCTCGCRGDFELTEKGLAHLTSHRNLGQQA